LSYFRSLVLFRHGICIHMHLRTLFRQHSECWHSECCLKETYILSKETYILSKETLILSTINANVQMRRAPWRKRNVGECVCICITRTSFWMNEFRTSRLEWRAQNDFWMSRFEFWILCEHVSLNDSFRIHLFCMTGLEWTQNDVLNSEWVIQNPQFVQSRHSGRLILNSFILNDVLRMNSEWVIQNFKFLLRTSFWIWLIFNSFIQNDVHRINSEWVIQNDVLTSECVTHRMTCSQWIRNSELTPSEFILNTSCWMTHSEAWHICSIRRLLKITGSVAEIGLFYMALLQKRPVI